MTNEDRIELVEEAQEKLREAIELLQAARLSRYDRAYVIDRLAVIASREHDFLTRDRNLDDILESLRHPDEDE